MPDNGETWIKVHDQMPEHPKIGGLSDKAFRLLIETWCWCKRQRNDGRFPLSAWQRMGTAKTRAELEAGQYPLVEIVNVAADLASLASLAEIANHETPRSPEDRYLAVIHDYDYWQTSNEQITERREKRRRAGSIGNHKRWHQGKGVVDPACEHCSQDRNGVASAIANGSQVGSQTDRKPIAETDKRSTSIQDLGENAPVDQRAHDRAQGINDPVGRGCSGRAYKIVKEHGEGLRRRPPAARLTQLGLEVDRLLAENWAEAEIAQGLDALDEKRLSPSQLSSLVYELAKTDERPRSVYAIPEDRLTEADIAEILGPADHDPNLPLPPEDIASRGLKGLSEWREEVFPEFHRKRRERAVEAHRQRIARAAGRSK